MRTMNKKQNLVIDPDIEEMLREIEESVTPYKLVLYNDECHEMYQVAFQIAKAIRCPLSQAFQLMLIAHHDGSVTLLETTEIKCRQAKQILDEIALDSEIISMDFVE